MKKLITKFLLGCFCVVSVFSASGNISFAATVEETNLDNEAITGENPVENNCLVTANVGSSFIVTLPKNITLSGNDGTGTYNVTVKGNISARQIVSVKPDKSFNLKSNGKDDIETTVSQSKQIFKYDELEVLNSETSELVGTTIQGEVNAGKLTKGEWSGSFNFYIDTYENMQISVEAKDEDENDLNAEAFVIGGQEKEDLLEALVQSDSVPDITNKDDINALVEIESDDFDNIAEAIFYVSGVLSEGDKAVVLHFKEDTKEWEYIGMETVTGGEFSCDFTSRPPASFVVVGDDGSLALKELEPGLYNARGEKLCSWEESGLDVEKDYDVQAIMAEAELIKGEEEMLEFMTQYSSWSYVAMMLNYPGTAKVVLPDTISRIGDYAFFGSYDMTEIYISSSISSISSTAFVSTSGLEVINVNQDNEFYASVDGVLLDKSKKTLMLYPGNRSGNHYVVPDTVEKINDHAFSSCDLESVELSENVTHIGDYAFNSCRDLESIEIPESVTYIGDHAFSSCEYIESIELPENVTHIGDFAFAYCHDLESIEIPKNVQYIGDGAFYGMQSITVDSNNNNFIISDNILYSKDMTRLLTCIPDSFSLSSYIVPDSVVSLGSGAFLDCTSLESIKLPSNLTSIGEYAFGSCSNLGSLEIPSGVVSIGYGAFYKCENIRSIKIPNGVTSIKSTTFEHCDRLESIELPSGITSIGESAFAYCGLINVDLPENLKSIGDEAFKACDSLTAIVIPKNVKHIGNWAFGTCDSLTSIVVEEGNTVFDSRDNCNAIIETKENKIIVACYGTSIPNTVTTIGKSSFNQVNNLTSLVIPPSVTTIEELAFGFCENSDITIPDTVLVIGEGAFRKVQHITYHGPAEGSPWDALSIN